MWNKIIGMEPDQFLHHLEAIGSSDDLQLLRKLIGVALSFNNCTESKDHLKWKGVLAKLLRILTENEEIGKEQILLTTHAFMSLLMMTCTLKELLEYLTFYLRLETDQFHFFDNEYELRNAELFKLLIIYGFLQVNKKNIYTDEALLLCFDIIYDNCIRYTRYSYFAYKVLQNWLHRTMNTDFWINSDSRPERKLEAVIFSNWDNSIKEISKRNATVVFNMYLKIMDMRYKKNFLKTAFESCVHNLSWQNETKYAILAEICYVTTDISYITTKDFILCLFTSLTKSYLRSAGTRVYNVILNKLDEDQWINVFGEPVRIIVDQWESGSKKNHNALQSLCKHWLEPTIEKFRQVLSYLWEFINESNGLIYRSNLERIASKLGIVLPNNFISNNYLDHEEEIVRLNAFAIYCQRISTVSYTDRSEDPFLAVKHFLFMNANANTTFLREGIGNHYRTFIINLIKLHGTLESTRQQIYDVLQWIHQFLLDCFEIGSCYQRKILGLNLYKTILFYINRSCANDGFLNDPRHKESLKYGLVLGDRLKIDGKWKFTDKQSLVLLLNLLLDPANDVRDLSAAILLEHFDKDSLTYIEKEILLDTAISKCNSSKFFEIESGAVIFKILTNWLPLETNNRTKMLHERTNDILNSHINYVDYLLKTAENQLAKIKRDILKAVVQGSPFYGVLIAILSIGFRRSPETLLITEQLAEKLLCLLEEAVNFFLSVLSSKSKDSEYSSSFAEMGLAIDETVKTSDVADTFDEIALSPAHQLVVSCIWMSLKVSCELASEIGVLMYSEDIVQRSVNVVASVLMRCRHKGAIEGAGLAIAQLTRILCKEDKYNKIPETYLRNLIKNGNKTNPNLTRRGAGLSIMFHKIVASDNRKDRPLLHFAIGLLLDSLKNSPQISTTDNAEGLHDSPCARNLHFLCSLVGDKELHAQLVPYLEEISLICFTYLESQTWTIRNASLQLFGVIVPRIVGQCVGGKQLDFGNGYSVNHFVTHYPSLALHILKHLQSFPTIHKLQLTSDSHSSLVHILTVLSKMSTGGCNFIDYSSKDYLRQAKYSVHVLFANPVGHVRILASKAYAALTAFPQIAQELISLKTDVLKVKGINLIHGHLCAMRYLKEKLANEMENANPYYQLSIIEKQELSEGSDDKFFRVMEVLNFWKSLSSDKSAARPCYVVEKMFLELSDVSELSLNDLILFDDTKDNKVSILSAERTRPGFFAFVQLTMQYYTNYVNRTGDIQVEVINRILHSHCLDQSISFLNHLQFHTPIIETILDYMLKATETSATGLSDTMINFFIQSLRHLSSSAITKLKENEKIRLLILKLKGKHTNSKLEQLRRVLTIIFSREDDAMNEIISFIFNASSDADEKIRQLATEYIEFLMRDFATLQNHDKLKILTSCLLLLKDEVSEIKVATINNLEILNNNFSTEKRSHRIAEVLYHEILTEIISNRANFANFSRSDIYNFIQICTDTVKCSETISHLESPFDHENDASQREETKLLNTLFYCMRYTIDNDSKSLDFTKILSSQYELQKEAGLDLTDLQKALNTKYMDYLMAKKNVVSRITLEHLIRDR
ncbi:uncharacterized protein LOC107263882 [Cephus cinctus]|uniref:Uncharacterized protein LOC107263882 n=1 Tax=Cephus cinctus TaxID=211228 RepID=A0AAJ7RAP6_CEPCN|nr:uncharacterized protein LOC107263882 [Cephus cinctus]